MAKRFTFRLETVLRLRQRAFEEAQRVVATRLRAIGRERSMIEAARVQISEQVAQSRAVQSADRLDVGSVCRHRAYVMFLSRGIAECTERMRQHEKELAAERKAMIDASVAVKAIEKLKERRLARHLAELNRQETAEQNEFAIQMHRRGTDLTPCLSAEGSSNDGCA